MNEPHLFSGWGRTVPTAAELRTPSTVADLAKSVLDPPERGVVARGLGRAYNDAAQNAGGVVIDATGVNEPATWQPDADGVITLPAGVSFDALLRNVVPRGYFVPVSPGGPCWGRRSGRRR
jgi:decaprenylphospho-beta-D-ribofuranose 2-oxidase